MNSYLNLLNKLFIGVITLKVSNRDKLIFMYPYRGLKGNSEISSRINNNLLFRSNKVL